MRSIIILIVIGVLLVGGHTAARAELRTAQDEAKAQAAERERKLDILFNALGKAQTEESARALASQIWGLWYQSGNVEVDYAMQLARQAMRAGQLQIAIEHVDSALKVMPNYSEGWNLRATILFYQGKDAQSVVDIERTLALEPRHFGALAGMMMINLRAENWKGALTALKAALKIHPFLRERALLERIEKQVKDSSL